MNFSSGSKFLILHNSSILFLNTSSFTSSIWQSGNTPINNEWNNEISSDTNFGIKVSQTDFNKIFCSHFSIGISSVLFAFFLSESSLLFKLPAFTKTLFKALKPKS